ncbi:MAG: hypothetical protein ABI068_11080 [Ktedonobacterales bacterium]
MSDDGNSSGDTGDIARLQAIFQAWRRPCSRAARSVEWRNDPCPTQPYPIAHPTASDTMRSSRLRMAGR